MSCLHNISNDSSVAREQPPQTKIAPSIIYLSLFYVLRYKAVGEIIRATGAVGSIVIHIHVCNFISSKVKIKLPLIAIVNTVYRYIQNIHL